MTISISPSTVVIEPGWLVVVVVGTLAVWIVLALIFQHLRATMGRRQKVGIAAAAILVPFLWAAPHVSETWLGIDSDWVLVWGWGVLALANLGLALRPTRERIERVGRRRARQAGLLTAGGQFLMGLSWGARLTVATFYVPRVFLILAPVVNLVGVALWSLAIWLLRPSRTPTKSGDRAAV